MSQYADFRQQAEECVQFERRAKTVHNRQLLHDMAMAWLGRKDEAQLLRYPKSVEPPRTDHPRHRH